jgi:hypothetical protein
MNERDNWDNLSHGPTYSEQWFIDEVERATKEAEGNEEREMQVQEEEEEMMREEEQRRIDEEREIEEKIRLQHEHADGREGNGDTGDGRPNGVDGVNENRWKDDATSDPGNGHIGEGRVDGVDGVDENRWKDEDAVDAGNDPQDTDNGARDAENHNGEGSEDRGDLRRDSENQESNNITDDQNPENSENTEIEDIANDSKSSLRKRFPEIPHWNDVELESYKSFENCRAACEANLDCFQFVFYDEEETTCRLGMSFRLGEYFEVGEVREEAVEDGSGENGGNEGQVEDKGDGEEEGEEEVEQDRGLKKREDAGIEKGKEAKEGKVLRKSGWMVERIRKWVEENECIEAMWPS